MVGTQDTMGRGAGTAGRVCAVRSIRVRGPSVTETSWGSHRGSSESNSLSGVPNLNRRLFIGARVRGLSDPNPGKRGRWCELRWSGPEGEDTGKIVLGGEMGASSTAGEVANAAKLRSISFTKLSIGSAVDGFGTLLGDLELLELGSEDVGSTDRLIVIEEHDPMVDSGLK